MAIIVDGNALSRQIRGDVAARFSQLVPGSGLAPAIAIVEVGASAAASAYTRRLERTFMEASVSVAVHRLPTNTPLEAITALVRELSADPRVHGIQIQAPLPPHLPLSRVVEALDPAKDLDGIHPYNAGLLAQGAAEIVPATPAAGLEILLRHGVAIAGARAVVVGRSPVVGRPLALLLLQHHATVTICHTRTRDLGAVTREGEILAVAAGQAGLVSADMVRPGAAVIDFGANMADGRTIGDVDPRAADGASLFTPVPGGTGPVTAAMLLRNSLALYERAIGTRPA